MCLSCAQTLDVAIMNAISLQFCAVLGIFKNMCTSRNYYLRSKLNTDMSHVISTSNLTCRIYVTFVLFNAQMAQISPLNFPSPNHCCSPAPSPVGTPINPSGHSVQEADRLIVDLHLFLHFSKFNVLVPEGMVRGT